MTDDRGGRRRRRDALELADRPDGRAEVPPPRRAPRATLLPPFSVVMSQTQHREFRSRRFSKKLSHDIGPSKRLGSVHDFHRRHRSTSRRSIDPSSTASAAAQRAVTGAAHVILSSQRRRRPQRDARGSRAMAHVLTALSNMFAFKGSYQAEVRHAMRSLARRRSRRRVRRRVRRRGVVLGDCRGLNLSASRRRPPRAMARRATTP